MYSQTFIAKTFTLDQLLLCCHLSSLLCNTVGVDYTVVREDLTIMISAGSPRERCIPVGIVNDSIALEEPETFIFEFDTLPSGVVRGENPTAVVNITEDDVSKY